MTDIGALCQQVYAKIEWQRFPPTYSDGDKEVMVANAVVEAIKDMFIVTGRALQYSNYTYTYEYDIPSEFSYTLLLDEEMYVICKAQIAIFGKVRAQYNDILGYTTNALTVTNADKPYAYISSTIGELEKQAQLYYYKMVRFSHL